ncbi:MAG: DUF4349 domain-containing protein [Lachnospiraceae bacterium]
MKKKGIGILLLSAILCLSGCGDSGSNKSEVKAIRYDTADMAMEEVQTDGIYNEAAAGGSYDTALNSTVEETESVRSGRKLIRTANLTVETLEFDELLDNLKTKADSLGGYAETYNVNNGSNYNSTYYSGTSAYRKNRNAYIVFRIPKTRVDEFLGEIADKGNVVSRNEQETDVTTEYVDLESHKATLKIEQERLMALLEEAQDLEDMLTIESRLSDIRYQLESIERSIRSYDSQIEYSTITLNVNEVVELTPVDVEEESTWERISKGFVDSLENIWDGLVEFFILFVVVLPYIVLTAVILGLFILILILIVKQSLKRQKRKMEKLAKEEEVKK